VTLDLSRVFELVLHWASFDARSIVSATRFLVMSHARKTPTLVARITISAADPGNIWLIRTFLLEPAAALWKNHVTQKNDAKRKNPALPCGEVV
jgi:hypothetical protein